MENFDYGSVVTPWGPLGEDLYKRTYSRKKADGSNENWAETVERVVEGNCDFVDKRFIENGEKKKLKELIYALKQLPAGRHLWSTGAEGRQYTSNCFVSGWGKEFYEHFCYAFLRLMEGGGVGTNYSSKYIKKYPKVSSSADVHVACNSEHHNYDEIKDLLSSEYSADWLGSIEVEDSREGWANALKSVIVAHFNGEKELIVFDITKIRPSGSRLKGSGGTASGPKPLIEMLIGVNKILNEKIGSKPDPMTCLAIDHELAKCVVAGNIRRSARMSLMHWKDEFIEEFINIKGSDAEHWTTNISVGVDTSFWRAVRNKDKQACKILDMIVDGIHKGGEPGIINMSKHQDGEIEQFFCTNPCLSPDTMVAVADGRCAVSIKELADMGEDVPVYCRDDNGNIVVRTMRNPRLTRKNANVCKISFDDNESICCTLDHKFVLITGDKKEAKNLCQGNLVDAAIVTNNLIVEKGVCPVVKIDRKPKTEDVYNGTVDDFHNFYAIHHSSKGDKSSPQKKYTCVVNCGEISGREYTACVLGHINLDQYGFEDEKELLESFRLMTRFLLRATYSDFPDPKTQKNVEEDRRIGVGFTGFHNWLIRNGIRFTEFARHKQAKEILKKAYEVVRETARDYAFQLRIPEPIKVTAIAPTGTVSKLAGISEGMQSCLFKYFIRRVCYSTTDPEQNKIIKQAEKNGLHVEDSVYTPKTKVVSYICKDRSIDIAGDESLVESAADININEYFELQSILQEIYADNAISVTVNFNKEELTKNKIKKVITKWGPVLKGTTLMPMESSRKQMPYEEITKEEYDKAPFKGVSSFSGNCNGGVCEFRKGNDE